MNDSQRYGRLISLKDLRAQFKEFNLISSGEISFNEYKSYSEAEFDTESNTHKNMRETAIKYFLKEGYDVYPYSVGVLGLYTLCDFVIVRNRNLIFVECLTDNNATKEVLERKMSLQKYGDVCFIFVGGNGYEDLWHQLPEILPQIPDDILIYLYYYGHFRNNVEKRIEEYDKPLTLENQEMCKKIGIRFEIEIKVKYCYITMKFPYGVYNKNRWYKFHFGEILNYINKLTYNSNFFIYESDSHNKRILMEKKNIVKKFKIKDKQGIKRFEEYVEELSKHFKVIFDKDKIYSFKEKIEK
ncbi:MAG: hypothetical protein ACLFUH_06420 [Bacteroidales bacterium]